MAKPVPLHVEGDQIKRPDGSIYKGIGTTEFAIVNRFLNKDAKPNGWEVLVKPVLRERMNAAQASGWTGDLIARVARNAAAPNAFAIGPWDYPMSAITDLDGLMHEEGWRVDWVGCDNQICFPTNPPGGDAELHGPRGFNEHVNQFANAILQNGGDLDIWCTCNEAFKNGRNTVTVPPPPWAPKVQYSGDYEDNRDKRYDLRCVNLHTDRNTEAGIPKWVGKCHESAPYMWAEGKPVIYDEGMGADEVNINGRRSNNPLYFGIMGSVLTMVSLVYFHSTAGLGSNGFGPVTMECWKAFCRGAAGAMKVGPWT